MISRRLSWIVRFPTILCILFLCFSPLPVRSQDKALFAFSLREANRLTASTEVDDPRLQNLAGISRISGMIYDEKGSDIILVGKTYDNLPPIALDDLVVGLRTRLKSLDFPKVSIDITEQTQSTGQQDVRLIGGIDNTQFGHDFFQSDVVLKLYSLGLLREVKGLTPFTKLYADREKRQLESGGTVIDSVAWLDDDAAADLISETQGKGVESSETLQSRFWFHVRDGTSRILKVENVYFIEELSIGVSEESSIVASRSSTESDAGDVTDISAEFSNRFTEYFEQVGSDHPVLFRLKALFDIVAVCEGIAQLGAARPDLQALLDGFPVTQVPTPEQYELVQRVGVLRHGDDTETIIQLSGGIDLEATLLALEDGDVTAFRDVVLASRPSKDALAWQIPIDHWEMPNDHGEIRYSDITAPSPVIGRELGFSLQVEKIVLADSGSTRAYDPFQAFSPLTATATLDPAPINFEIASVSTQPPPKSFDTISPQGAEVGGVLLAAKALQVDESGEIIVKGDTGFSLISTGPGNGISEEGYRKLVTALWAVYFSPDRPGISIDPVAPGVIDEHLVRYIGHVVNSDLGRVMREADYQMKKWAVGTEVPSIENFKDVDRLEMEFDAEAGNVSRRFWFVPETLRFREAEDALLFTGGQMMLRTEHDLERYGLPPLPSDRAFAAFFNANYATLAKEFPIFSELQTYGKMVALAGFLKDRQIPLLWFLQSNAHLIETEDSIWTVKELVKDSLSSPGEKIYGGVDYGALALMANESALRYALRSRKTDPKRPVEREFETRRDTSEETHQVLPIRSETGRADASGRIYHTDIALRRPAGEPGLEIVRYFDPARPEGGEFGGGWRLLLPYSLEFDLHEMEEFLNVYLPQKVEVTSHPVGTTEVLTFSPDHYAIAGWIPEGLDNSRIIGLFPMSDGSFRLVNKLGSEFHFTPDAFMTHVMYSPQYAFEIEYSSNSTLPLEDVTYRLQIEGDQTAVVANAVVPTELSVNIPELGVRERFRFDKANNFAQWYPESRQDSRFRFLAIMSDASFRLVDKENREIVFDGSGNFRGMYLPPDQRVITTFRMSDQTVRIKHSINENGDLIISSAIVDDHAVKYERGTAGIVSGLRLVKHEEQDR